MVREDVEKDLEPFDSRLGPGFGPGFVVHGQLKHPDTWRTMRCYTQLDIIFDTFDEKNGVMEQVRIPNSPSQLLHRRTVEDRGHQ